jgi:two-component system sensor histidine kinase/response regulator
MMTESTPYSILIVDDTQQNVQVLSQILRDSGYKVLAAFNGPDAINLVKKRTPDLILLDVMMPGMSGFEVAQKLIVEDGFTGLPIIFLSALDETEAKVKAFESGGVDYVTKPFQAKEVLARIELHLKLKSLEREREKYIEELKLKQEHLERINKEKDDILGIISHDMRNPLGGIIGISNFLLTDTVTEPEETHEMLSLIEKSAERLLDLVNDMLNVAIIESNSFSVDKSQVDLDALIGDMIQLHEPTAKTKHVNLKHETHETPLIVSLDASKISQIIGNLVSNAIKFTNPGGWVAVSSKVSPVDGKDQLFIQIQDNGIGIPDDIMPVLFDKMVGQRSGTDGEKGTGLGMPLVKRFVELHGGTIEVSSKVGQGSTFSIKIPLGLD